MLKKTILAIALVIMAILPANAGKVVTDSIQSKVLGTEVKYNVYLPDGYDKAPDAHYPVVYLLHGLYGTYKDWADGGNMAQVADELIRADACDKMVIIMPNAGNVDVRNVQNGYFNVEDWNYEDFFFTELLPVAEQKYRCGGCKTQRAIMGLSMGGGGSTVYCQRHPDMFSSCYAMSAWLDNEKNQVGGGEGPVKDKLVIVCESVKEHSAVRFIENADEKTLEQLRTVRWFIDCGDDDFLFDVNVRFYQAMRDRKVKAELRVRDGVHNWEYWHACFRNALPFASRGFKAE